MQKLLIILKNPKKAVRNPNMNSKGSPKKHYSTKKLKRGQRNKKEGKRQKQGNKKGNARSKETKKYTGSRDDDSSSKNDQ